MAKIDFTTALAKLQTSNLMSGEVIKGQAKLLEAQTKGTRNVITDFNARLQELEQEPLSTEEQLSAINEDPTVKENQVDLEKQLSTFASFSVNVLRRQEELNKLYGGTIQNLGMVGGEDAGRLVDVLSGQQKQKISNLERQRKLPFETQAFKQSMFQVESIKTDLLLDNIKLDDLKEDRKVTSLMAKIISGDEFSKLNLIFNQASGKKGFNLENFRNNMFLQYGSDPEFAKAWAGVDALIRKNTLNWRSQFSKTGNMGTTLMENITFTKRKYNELVEATKRMDLLRFPNETEDFQWVRDEYKRTALALFANDVKKRQKEINEFGSSLQVIKAMETGEDLAKEVYDVMYDKTSDQYYNKNYKDLGNLLTSQYGEYTPVSPFFRKGTLDNPRSYPLIDGSFLDPTKIIVPVDASLFPNGGGGYYDPGDPETYVDYESRVAEARDLFLKKQAEEDRLSGRDNSVFSGRLGNLGNVGGGTGGR